MVLRKTLFFWVLRNVKMGCKKVTLGSQIELFEYLKSLGVMNWTWFNIPWQIQLCLYMVHVYHSVFLQYIADRSSIDYGTCHEHHFYGFDLSIFPWKTILGVFLSFRHKDELNSNSSFISISPNRSLKHGIWKKLNAV